VSPVEQQKPSGEHSNQPFKEAYRTGEAGGESFSSPGLSQDEG
jgi:hypothetical protein